MQLATRNNALNFLKAQRFNLEENQAKILRHFVEGSFLAIFQRKKIITLQGKIQEIRNAEKEIRENNNLKPAEALIEEILWQRTICQVGGNFCYFNPPPRPLDFLKSMPA